MSETIHKFQLKPLDLQTLSLPGQCSILSAAEQRGDLMIWVRLNPENKRYDYEIAIVGTGQDMPPVTDSIDWQFIDTVHMNSGLVWHIFVKIDLDEIAESW